MKDADRTGWRNSSKSLGGRATGAMVAALAMLLTGLPAVAQTPPDPSTTAGSAAAGPDGFVFGDRSLIPAAGEEPPGDEVVSERTATSRTFETDVPGVFLTQQYETAANVETAQGWEPIDTTLEPAVGGFVNALDAVEVSVAGSADDAKLAAVELASGVSAGFSLDGASSVEADVDGDTAVYVDALDGVDVALQAVPGGVKETLTLASAQAANEFVFDLELDGLSAEVRPDGSVAMVSAAGVAKVTAPPGFMVDAAGVTSTAVVYSLSPDGASLVVTADAGWLANPARVFPVVVDPTLSVVADTDDTYVTEGEVPAVNHSGSSLLKVGFDGSNVHRSFLKFSGLAGYEGMNILAADLALWQSGSGSCTASPVDVHGITQTWDGTATTAWPGPSLDPTAAATVTSGNGHDASCPAGAVGTDLTRLVDQWASGYTDYNGIALRARDEASQSQFKAFVSANGDGTPGHRPTLSVLWSDPTQPGVPLPPSGLGPQEHTDTFNPVFESAYVDPEGDDGFVVYFAYFAGTGAFAGAVVSPVVDSGATAAVSGYLPLDLPLTWRAQAVDDAHQLPSPMTEHVPLTHPSVRVATPAGGDVVEATATVAAEVDPSITDATGVTFAVDGTVVGSATSAPYETSVDTFGLTDGDHSLTATIAGGAHAGTVSAPVPIYVDNVDGEPEGIGPEAQPRGPVLRRTLGVVDDTGAGEPEPPIDTGGGDCGWSEPLPDGNVLWLICDRTIQSPFSITDSVAGLAPASDPTNPVWRPGRFLGTPPAGLCPDYLDDEGETRHDRALRWMTGVASFAVPRLSGTGPDDTMVVIFFHQGCQHRLFQGPLQDDHDPGTAGVATYRYTYGTTVAEFTSTSPAVSPVVRNDRLWLGRIGVHTDPTRDFQIMHGTGAVYVAPSGPETTGYLYAYGCKGVDLLVNIRAYGRCNVARAAVDESTFALVGIRSRWTYWNGTTWLACPNGCAEDDDLADVLKLQRAMRLPDAQNRSDPPNGATTCADGYAVPCPDPYRVSQHFEVTYSAQFGAYVVAHQLVFGERHMSMMVRVADTPVGPWSLPLAVPIKCDGRVRDNFFYNCYQFAPHPHLTDEAGTTTVFGYYDHFEGTYGDDLPDPDTQETAIRFVEVPVCVRRAGSGAIAYVRGRCLMTGPATPSLWAEPLSRQETVAVLWRLGGFDPFTAAPSTDSLPRSEREAASYFLASPLGFTEVWPIVADLVDAAPTTRSELIRLLWRSKRKPDGDYPLTTLSDYSTAWGTGLRSALEWAYGAGVVCDPAFEPATAASRAVAADWVRRVHKGNACT